MSSEDGRKLLWEQSGGTSLTDCVRTAALLELCWCLTVWREE